MITIDSSISPVVSVVTVVYNRAGQIEATMRSVFNQTFQTIEYIIIDGGSTDGTVDVIKKYDDKIAHWVSERDKGIYDAMNKGVDAARGEWIILLNCGDRLASPDALEIFRDKRYDVDIIYGDAIIEYPTFQTLYKKTPLNELWKGMSFCHQATFARAPLMKEYKFNVRYKQSADFDFLNRAYEANKKFLYVDQLICLFDFKDGDCKSNAFNSIYERKTAALSYNPSLPRRIYFTYLILYTYASEGIKKLIGNKPTAWITRLLKA
jgi:glycosyltransferase involved in cell wall biosynthesis